MQFHAAAGVDRDFRQSNLIMKVEHFDYNGGRIDGL